MAGNVLLAEFSWGWDALVAIGTIGLAATTAWLAWSTRALAVASRKDERAQWRPVLVPTDRALVDYDDARGAMSFEIRNVGHGPAFGVNAQIRSGRRPLGASVPVEGGATALTPGESFRLQALMLGPVERIRGIVVEADIAYYDITERWHRSIFTITSRGSADGVDDASANPPFRVAKVFVYETERDLLPVLGSPKALARQAREQRRLGRRARQVAAHLRHRGRDGTR